MITRGSGDGVAIAFAGVLVISVLVTSRVWPRAKTEGTDACAAIGFTAMAAVPGAFFLAGSVVWFALANSTAGWLAGPMYVSLPAGIVLGPVLLVMSLRVAPPRSLPWPLDCARLCWAFGWALASWVTVLAALAS